MMQKWEAWRRQWASHTEVASCACDEEIDSHTFAGVASSDTSNNPDIAMVGIAEAESNVVGS